MNFIKRNWVGLSYVALVIFIVTMISVAVRDQPPPPPKIVKPIDPKYGAEPNTDKIEYVLPSMLRDSLKDADSLKDVKTYKPTRETIRIKGKKVDCWKVQYSFRAKNSFGAVVLTYGAFWIRDEQILQHKGPSSDWV